MNLTEAAARYPQAAKELDEIRSALTMANTERMQYFTALHQIQQAHDASADELRAMAMDAVIPF